MHILSINVGSSSVKAGVFDKIHQNELFSLSLDIKGSVQDAIHSIPGVLREHGNFHIDAVGHRIAHGGHEFTDSCVITDVVEQAIERCTPLAPLHNPYNLLGVRLAKTEWPVACHVAVFDTTFHKTIPEHAYRYAIPDHWMKLGIRRYGFHGTSYHYIRDHVAQTLNMPIDTLKIICCHLGSGASICAIKNGVSVDTSMGMTALEGVAMGTRSGDLDPGVFAFLARQTKMTPDEIEMSLYKDSGLAALSGGSHDMRDLEQRVSSDDPKALLAIQVFTYRIRKYIGSYMAAMGGVDVLVFTGGIGENSALCRDYICQDLAFLGIELDSDKNKNLKLKEREAPELQRPGAKVKIIATKTQEEWMIAREALLHVGDK